MKNFKIQKNLHQFVKAMENFYRRSGRKNLPWRKSRISAYEVWASEVMLQQTQVSRVIPFYRRFLKRFPDIFSLAADDWEDFLPYYRGLGYYSRGRNMLKTAKIVVENFGGIFPQEKNALKKLPGIGAYTADAILAFAYGKNVLAFDTNLQKVFGRYFFGKKIASIDKKIEENLQKEMVMQSKIKKSFPMKKLNAAVMDFANIICTNKPKCEKCPLSQSCQYFLLEKHLVKNRARPKSLFPLAQAQVFLSLHRDHKEYFSPNPDQLEPFVLEPPINTRSEIKRYFLEKYGLEVSVRPPHKKEWVENILTLFINAQILRGKHEFGIFKLDIFQKTKRNNRSLLL